MSSNNKILACDLCEQLLETPVCFPCGHTVCEQHILDTSLQVSPCRFSNKKHSSSLPFGYNEKIAGSIAKYNDALSACKAAEEKQATLIGM